jgi:hypothetical protein
MAADQGLERVKIARLRRRDKEPITGLDYHRVAAVARNTARGRAERTGSPMLSSLRPSQQGARAASVRSLDQPALFGVLLPCAALREPGWPDDQASVREAVRRGTAAGALACTQFGAMKGLPTGEELERFMAVRS